MSKNRENRGKGIGEHDQNNEAEDTEATNDDGYVDDDYDVFIYDYDDSVTMDFVLFGFWRAYIDHFGFFSHSACSFPVRFYFTPSLFSLHSPWIALLNENILPSFSQSLRFVSLIPPIWSRVTAANPLFLIT